MTRVKNFLKTSVIYLFGRVSSALITFLLLPIYTSKISPDRYGYYELVISILAVVVPIVCFDIWFGVLRLSYDSEEPEYKDKIITTGIITLLGPLVIFTIGMVVFNKLYQPDNMFLIFLYSITWILNLFIGMIARALSANLIFATSGIIGSLTNACVGLFCVYVLKLQDEALFFAMIASYLTQIIYISISLKVWKRIKIRLFDIKISAELFIFCCPFSLNTIAYYFQNNYNKVIISKSLGLEQLGLFSVAGKFMIIASLTASIFHLAWQETAFSISDNNEKSTFYSIGLNVFLELTAIGTVLLLPIVKILFPFVIGGSFQEAQNLIPFYYIAVFTTTMNGFVSNILTAEKETFKLVIAKIVGGSVNLALVFSLINKIGIWSAIFGFVIGTAVELIVMSIIVKKIINIKVEFKSIVFLIIFYSIGVYFFVNRNYQENIIWFIICFIISLYSCFKIFNNFKTQDRKF